MHVVYSIILCHTPYNELNVCELVTHVADCTLYQPEPLSSKVNSLLVGLPCTNARQELGDQLKL